MQWECTVSYAMQDTSAACCPWESSVVVELRGNSVAQSANSATHRTEGMFDAWEMRVSCVTFEPLANSAAWERRADSVAPEPLANSVAWELRVDSVLLDR